MRYLVVSQSIRDYMSKTIKNNRGKKATAQAIDPKSRTGRIVLTMMITKLFDHWKLSADDQLVLLGIEGSPEIILGQYRKGEPFDDNADLLNRVAILLSIHRSLRILFPQDLDLVYKWPRTSNRAFGGLSPVEFIRKKGFAGLMTVKRYLDSEIER